MRSSGLLLGLALLLAAGCGKKDQPPPPGATAQGPSAPVAEPPPPAGPSPEELAAQRQALEQKRAELEAKVRELAKAQKELAERHASELRGLPEAAPLRRSYVTAIVDARKKEAALERLLERERELKKYAESAVRGKLKELREERAGIETRQRAIQDAWRASIEDARLGAIQESPVKKDLDTLRAVKLQWFAATPLARRGTAKESEKRIINDGFRGWLSELEDRKRVVGQILDLPQAPKGKSPDSYDFTDLKFYILLELMEEQLERQNIAVEKKELAENRAKLEAIQQELDAIDAKIHEQMVAGGDELAEYEELLDRKKPLQESASYLSTRVSELAEVLKQIEAIKERQAQEETDAARALEEAKQELQQVARQLR